MCKQSLHGFVIAVMVLLAFSTSLSWSVVFDEETKTIVPDRAAGKIVIDGALDEAVWQEPPIKQPFTTFMPTFGKPLGRDTWVWTAYDKGNLYFAFRCFEPEPGKIKTSIVQRDKIFQDDYVGVLLDALGTRQSSTEFYVNPNGIQGDVKGSSVSGSDITPDFVWHSAAKLVPAGYQVEIRVPLKSIRYQARKGKEVRMAVIFLRAIPHLGVTGTWPAYEAGQTMYNFMATMVVRGLSGALKLEVLPNVTYSRDSQRIAADAWQHETDTNVGVGIKYGITSSITAEAAVNPDFSHVESDVFQVEVNRRYPVFYSEKRPFFMESKEVLDFTIIKESMMIAPIHTRRIADPSWALKLSGSAGKMNFAFLAADDRSAGRPWDVGVNPDEGKNALFGIVRAKYNLGSDNSLGILYSGRHFAGQRNDVVGADLKYRLSKALRASFSYLGSFTRQDEGDELARGGGLNAMLEYNSPKLISWAIYERYSSDFFMATAFQNRVGISRGAFGIGPIFHIDWKGLPWLKRFIPFVHYYRLYDLGTRMTDVSREYALNFRFAPLGVLFLEYWHEDEAWAGRMFDKKYFYSYGFIQLFKWLFLTEEITLGEQIYYHPTEPLLGNGRTIYLGLTVQPEIKLRVGFDYTHAALERKEDKQKLYSVNIYNLHTTYQFNRYFFLRAILRYDSFQDKLLTDLLASFTLIPGTVVHLGYGSLHLRGRWQDGLWLAGQGDLLRMKQGLFFKASYLWRIK